MFAWMTSNGMTVMSLSVRIEVCQQHSLPTEELLPVMTSFFLFFCLPRNEPLKRATTTTTHIQEKPWRLQRAKTYARIRVMQISIRGHFLLWIRPSHEWTSQISEPYQSAHLLRAGRHKAADRCESQTSPRVVYNPFSHREPQKVLQPTTN